MVVLVASSWHGACDICTDWRLHGVARGVLARYLYRMLVQFVDSTGLPELHKDAHTAVHTLQGKLLILEQQADPKTPSCYGSQLLATGNLKNKKRENRRGEGRYRVAPYW
jgi:hypothetical protein